MTDDLDRLANVVACGQVVVLSGAGISTESGIPDYRGPSGASLRRHAPMTYQAFRDDPVARRRYWARSHVGWQLMRTASPNDGHRAVAELERHGIVTGTITQNVDGLHQSAGSRDVIDLHGRLDRVVCLSCGTLVPRTEVRERLDVANRDWSATVTAVNPDGDVDLADEQLDGFTVVDCATCGGLLKPDVVYFGENVPRRAGRARPVVGGCQLAAARAGQLAARLLRTTLRRARDQVGHPGRDRERRPDPRRRRRRTQARDSVGRHAHSPARAPPTRVTDQRVASPAGKRPFDQ